MTRAPRHNGAVRIADGTISMSEVTKIKGVGPVLAKAFTKKGFVSIENVAACKAADLATVSGVSETRAKELIKAAKLLLKNLALTDAARRVKAAKKAKKKAPKNKKKNKKLAKGKKLEKRLKSNVKKMKKMKKKMEKEKKK